MAQSTLGPADVGKLDAVEESLARAIMLLQEVSSVDPDSEVSIRLRTALNEANSSLKVVKIVKEENEPKDGS